MSDEINVTVVKYPDRVNLVMRFVDPATGKQIARSTGTAKQREAVKAAAKWEAELREGRYQRTSRMAWQQFTELFLDDRGPRLRPSTRRGYGESLDMFERLCRPRTVGDLTTARVTGFVAELRKPEPIHDKQGKQVGERSRTEATIARHLRHVKVAARWAHRQGLLPKLPAFDMPKRSAAGKMKGRPITLEEFERMLAATEKVVGEKPAESWKLLLRGLWATGLRLGEAMALRWDHQPGGVSVDLDGKQSVLVFDADSQKSGRDELVPLTPEAVNLLEPRRRARGWVFEPMALRGEIPLARHTLKVGKIISRIGAQAKVVTDPAKGSTATAHDLRRSFGCRWAKLVMPSVLKEIMRHADISTTLTYYARQSAHQTAAELWAVGSGNTLGNTAVSGAAATAKTPRK